MSFGFSIGDFVALGDLALRIYRKCKSAGEDYSALADEVYEIQGPLTVLDHEIQSSGSWFSQISHHQLAGLVLKANEDCKAVLQEIADALKKYEDVDPKGPGGRRMRRMLHVAKFSGDVEHLKELEKRVRKHRETLVVVFQLTGLRNTNRVEQHLLGFGEMLQTMLQTMKGQSEGLNALLDIRVSQRPSNSHGRDLCEWKREDRTVEDSIQQPDLEAPHRLQQLQIRQSKITKSSGFLGMRRTASMPDLRLLNSQEINERGRSIVSSPSRTRSASGHAI